MVNGEKREILRGALRQAQGPTQNDKKCGNDK